MLSRSPTTISRRALAALGGLVLAGLTAATLLVAGLEFGLGVGDASLVYVVPVVVVATRFGTRAGIATAILSFVAYDFLFTEPRFTLVVADSHELLDLVLFLFVALAVGRLSALGMERATLAEVRAGESQAQFAVSRQLATKELDEAIPAILARIAADTGLARAWVTVDSAAGSRLLADTRPGEPVPGSGIVDVLVRQPGDEPARWIRAHAPSTGPRLPAGTTRLRVRIDAEGETLGSLWAIFVGGLPGREPTRLLALTADQLGIALRREQLRRSAVDAEISRRSDLLKSSLITSVSHDLRTPLAGIRAAAGGLLDPATSPDRDTVTRAATEIDAAARRLDRLVRGLLDLGRIESGLLRPDLEAFDLGSMVETAVDRLRPALGDRSIEIDIPDSVPPVQVDGLLFDEVLGNLLENVARHAPAPAPCRIRSTVPAEGEVDLVVEDGGPGVAETRLDRMFAPFTHADGGRPDRGAGTGIGLAVVRGFASAMGIDVIVGRSTLGGLAVTLRLRSVDVPPAEAVA
jgi:two-component system sensor histidine kinase KdpD